MLLLSACETMPIAVERTIPNYSASYLDQVANEWESGFIGPAVSAALMDWMVMSEL
jgi:hypothetical protein